MKKIDGLTPDLVAARIGELRAIFPEVFKDGKVDFDALQNALGEYVEDAREKYSFTWAGKLDSIRLAQKRSTGTLRPCREESVDFDTTENLYIEGDNLEVLKLLSGSYMNQVKMIYIDPPYNTGNDFVYADDFSDSIENYKKIIGETAKSNPESAGRFHTNWLNMMLPRLKLARVLLKPEGVIFISIDDTEMTNLRKLCDEVFGEYNFVAQIPWIKRVSPANDSKWYSGDHEYVLVYAKSKDNWHPKRTQRTEEHNSYYKNPDNDPRGAWNSAAYTCNKSRSERPNLYYPITNPNTGEEIYPSETAVWAYSREAHAENEKNNLLYWGVDGKSKQPRRKTFLYEAENVVPRSHWHYSEVGSTQTATTDLRDLFGGAAFPYPKPVKLLTKAIYQATESNDIILDFFSGSATTAHAVMQQNAEDGGKRKFICVQIPEITDEDSEANKAGYKTICEIGKERIRRAGKKIKDDSPMTTMELDTGFKVFKLDASNLRKWDNSYTRDYAEIANRVLDYYDYLLPDRMPIDLVYEIMLKYSLPLTLPVTEVTAAGATAHIITHAEDETAPFYKVLVCMQPDLTIEQMEALSAVGAGTLFFADRCFTDTNAMTNCDEIIKKAGQEMRLF